jgi:uncharacterized protein YceK
VAWEATSVPWKHALRCVGAREEVRVSRARGRCLARTLLGAATLLGLSGCQTFRSWEQGCPGIYSGVRFYAEQVGELPIDGQVFFTMDLILTSLADTLSLPGTAFAEPEAPAGGFALGCRWATRQAVSASR